jgi:hypothetical protein
MRLMEITNPNIDKQLLNVETLTHPFAIEVYSFYKDNISRTNNYASPAVDIFSFEELNRYVMAVSRLLSITDSVFDRNSETYKIAEFLSRYFSYFES